MAPRKLAVVAPALLGLGLAGVAFAAPASVAQPPGVSTVTVGANGNEPLIAVAPNGVLYVSALQYLYRSADHGVTWSKVTTPITADSLEVASDSSIAVDPGGRLYFSYDWPYAGNTSVCTSDNGGRAWACDHAVFAGGTDRMWVAAPTAHDAYVTTNLGLYQTVYAHSDDRGASWTRSQTTKAIAQPYTGQPVRHSGGPVVQPVATGPVQQDNAVDLQVNIYDPNAPAGAAATVQTGLPAPYALPSAAYDAARNLYVVTERVTRSGGRAVAVGRSSDDGAHWTTLPALPGRLSGTTSGTATFTAIAASGKGRVAVAYYFSRRSGAPAALTTVNDWQVVYADSRDADTAHPHWRMTALEDLGHRGAICRGLLCEIDLTKVPPTSSDARFAGDCLGVALDKAGNGYVSWVGETGRTPHIRFARVKR